MDPKTIRAAQEALNAKGFGPLVVDGVKGPNTDRAIIAFKKSVGLRARPKLGPITLGKLLQHPKGIESRMPARKHFPPWYLEMLKHVGKSEFDPAIAAWLRSDGATVGDPSKIPWCGDAVATSLSNTLPGIILPDNPYAAINWMDWGRPVAPQLGCLLVFWRESPSSWKGHIGNYAGESKTHFYVLGGNQQNEVNISPIAKSRLRRGGAIWPVHPDAPKPKGITVPMSGGVVSHNEA